MPCAAGGMGFLRDRSEFRDLEAEPIARLWVHLKYLNQHTAIAALRTAPEMVQLTRQSLVAFLGSRIGP